MATSCSSDDGNPNNLALLTNTIPFKTGTVIACASGSENPNSIIAYTYLRPEASDLRFFETENATVNELDYEKYQEVEVTTQDFFNGYLQAIEHEIEQEKWIVITFMEGDTLQLSNPIRLKHKTGNTLFTEEISIASPITVTPHFNWEQNVHPLDAIYFQVVTNATNDLLSGTYTLEPHFQYYNTENVVLNITRDLPPPQLVEGNDYGITVMGVSEDNWVHFLATKLFRVSN